MSAWSTVKHFSTICALQHGPTLCFTAVTALWGLCWVSVAAAGQAAAFLQEELHAGWTDCAVARTRSLALSAWAVTSLTLGFVLLQTQNTGNAPLILCDLHLTWQFYAVIHYLGCHLWAPWVSMWRYSSKFKISYFLISQWSACRRRV